MARGVCARGCHADRVVRVCPIEGAVPGGKQLLRRLRARGEAPARGSSPQRRGINSRRMLYAMLREFGGSIAGAVTIGDPQSRARRSQPRYRRPVSDSEIIARLRRAASDGDLLARTTRASWSMPNIMRLPAEAAPRRVRRPVVSPEGLALHPHRIDPGWRGRPDELAQEALRARARRLSAWPAARTELVGNGVRQYLVIEAATTAPLGRGDRHADPPGGACRPGARSRSGWTTTRGFQDPQSPRDSRRLSAYRIAELLGSPPGRGHPA